MVRPTVAGRPRRADPAEVGPDGRWDPWAALRARDHIELHFDEVAGMLGGAMLVLGPDLTAIVIDPRLDRRSRRVALAHELVHEERGGGCDAVALPTSLDVLVARDEAEVVREVARRLVPPHALRLTLQQREELHDPLAPWEVAEAFDVDDLTACTALAGLAHAAP